MIYDLIAGDEWVNEQQTLLWGMVGPSLSNKDMAGTFAELKFGAPHICRLADGTWFVVFWAVENGTSAIKWIKLDIA
jgi:hypothetical protein